MDPRRQDWLNRVYRRSHSQNSRHAVEMALRAFDREIGEPAERVIAKVKSNQLDVYETFDKFVGSLDKAEASPSTITGYVNRIMRYFAFNDVVVDSVRFRAKVVMPRVEDPDDRAPTVEELRSILSWGKLRTKTLILVMATSGMRLGEAIVLKIGHIDFASKPTRITLSSKVAKKTGKGRTVYISDEATEYLKRYLGERNNADLWVFPSEADEHNHVSEDRAWSTITECIEKAGLGKGKETTTCGRRKIHPYSLRKFFFSKAVGVIGETATHAMMGHGSYQQTYYRRTEEERAKDYLKCMPHLFIFKDNVDLRNVKSEAALAAMRAFAEAYGIDPLRVKIEKQKETGKEPTTDEEIAAIQNEIKKLRAKESEPKTIVTESELQQYLAQGWDVSTVLPSGKIVVTKVNQTRHSENSFLNAFTANSFSS
ncbi:MAG: site-specific integrase [Candidatus Bathyarchaeia archaeon]